MGVSQRMQEQKEGCLSFFRLSLGLSHEGHSVNSGLPKLTQVNWVWSCALSPFPVSTYYASRPLTAVHKA